MPAFRATTQLGPRRRRVERITTDAVEDCFSAFELEPAVVTAIIIQPQAKKNCRHEEAVDYNRSAQLEHRQQRGRSNAARQALSAQFA
jgi:hypothetical protein